MVLTIVNSGTDNSVHRDSLATAHCSGRAGRSECKSPSPHPERASTPAVRLPPPSDELATEGSQSSGAGCHTPRTDSVVASDQKADTHGNQQHDGKQHDNQKHDGNQHGIQQDGTRPQSAEVRPRRPDWLGSHLGAPPRSMQEAMGCDIESSGECTCNFPPPAKIAEKWRSEGCRSGVYPWSSEIWTRQPSVATSLYWPQYRVSRIECWMA